MFDGGVLLYGGAPLFSALPHGGTATAVLPQGRDSRPLKGQSYVY